MKTARAKKGNIPPLLQKSGTGGAPDINEDLRALIDYRMEEAHDALEEATILLHSQKARGALNRVYYAMFYAVLALLASRQLSASKHSGRLRFSTGNS